MDDLVTPDWLAGELGAPDLRVLDASDHPLEPARDAAAEFRARHIPKARFLDLATLADSRAALPATVPPLETFAARMAALGVARDHRILLYDDAPHHTSARAWWLLRLFGAERVAILDGGLAGWLAAGQPVEAGDPAPQPITPANTGFGARDDRTLARLGDVAAVLAAGGQVADARSPARFSGAEPDPRPGVAPGHMPGARNLHYAALFDADGRWKRGPALAAAFAAADVDPAWPTVFTCGSGITAAVLLFGAHRLGHDHHRLYDGSWSEWGADPATPKESL